MDIYVILFEMIGWFTLDTTILNEKRRIGLQSMAETKERSFMLELYVEKYVRSLNESWIRAN